MIVLQSCFAADGEEQIDCVFVGIFSSVVEGSVAENILAVESSLVGEEHLAWRLDWRWKSASGVGAETHLYDLKVPADNCSVGTVSVKKSDLKKNLKGLCTQRTASFESGGRGGGGGG